MKKVVLILLVVLLLPVNLFADSISKKEAAELRREIKELRQEVKSLKRLVKSKKGNISVSENSESEIERLRKAAEIETGGEKSVDDVDTTTVFKGGQTSQQAVNPEISVTGDFVTSYMNGRHYATGFRDGSYLRVGGLHIQSDLDPFSFAKFAIEFHDDSVELGEGYVTWTGIFPNLNLTIGKFRQQFGVVNRWHLHSLDQVDYPLALTTILGDDGLNEKGLSIDWQMPRIFGTSNEFTLQVTNNENENLFAGDKYGKRPAVLGHLKNFFDLGNGKYFELGLTGMVGENNQFGLKNSAGVSYDESKRLTKVGGLDLTYRSEPESSSHYSGWIIRSEYYWAQKYLLGDAQIKAHGGYLYYQKRLNERLYAGLRYDWTRPFTLNNDNDHIYQIVPYFTFWQSHWMRTRLQYTYKKDTRFTNPDHRIDLQFTWAMGPHKHERY